MRLNFSKYIVVFTLGFFFLPQNSVEASPAWKNDTALLPQYCKDRAQGTKGAFAKWRSVLGAAYIHTHHYCNGIYAEKKAKSVSDQRNKNKLLGAVIGEMRYVSRHCPVGCVLYPELHARLGWALGQKKQYAEAIKHYRLAIQAKSSYEPAYSQLSDLYVDMDQPDKARKVLENGLKAKPKSRALQRRLKKLEKTEE